MIDRWEEEIAEGRTPDFLSDAFTPEELEKLERLKKRGRARVGDTAPTFKEVAERHGPKHAAVLGPVPGLFGNGVD